MTGLPVQKLCEISCTVRTVNGAWRAAASLAAHARADLAFADPSIPTTIPGIVHSFVAAVDRAIDLII
jgi:hypothetical protein